MKLSPVKRKFDLIDEIAQIENTKSKNPHQTANTPTPKSDTQRAWFDALNDSQDDATPNE